MRRGERGTAILEVALALPVLLFLTLGLFDFGRAVYTRTVLGNAARDAARFASIDPGNAACVRAVAGHRDNLVGLVAADVTYAPPAAPRIDQPVSVTVQSVYQPLTPMIAELLPRGTLTLRAAATMRVRNVPATPQRCPPPA